MSTKGGQVRERLSLAHIAATEYASVNASVKAIRALRYNAKYAAKLAAQKARVMSKKQVYADAPPASKINPFSVRYQSS